MPRPRFASLSAPRRGAILAAAAEELAAHGWERSSYNRIIARSGVSKGAMYYYFDDKADLCLTALRDAIARAELAVGPVPEFADAPGFWDALGEVYRRVVAFVLAEPNLAGLLRRLLAAPLAPTLSDELARYAGELRARMHGFLERGRRVGAVREDVDLELLTDLLMALGEAQDRWALGRLDELAPGVLEHYAELALGLHRRLAAPLELVREWEARR